MEIKHLKEPEKELTPKNIEKIAVNECK